LFGAALAVAADAKAITFQVGRHLARCGSLLLIAARTKRAQGLVIWALGFSAAFALGLRVCLFHTPRSG